MPAILMPPASDFNVKLARKVGCWLCEHFQSYGLTSENGQVPTCEGECRKDPPRAGAFVKQLGLPADWPRDGYFTFIPFGNTAWCNGFQRSLQENIDPIPYPLSSGCPHTDPITWIVPDSMRTQNLPSKKLVTESCWYCNSFQRLFVDPSQVAPPVSNACLGYCQHAPQPDYFWQEGFIPPGPMADTVQTFPLFTKIPYAPLTWCSRWEPSTTDVPAVPAGNGTVCEDGQP